jgi:phosphopantothenoylcysteine decarboxylase/phosphopantothenate--cysteine ligase
MNLLSGKKILLGISGGIAAYKTPLIVREIIKQGAEVRVVITPAAKDFVTPLTLATLSKNPVLSTFTATDLDNPVWNDHVELGLWADIFLIAPATSNTLSAMAQGQCNNLLLAVYLSAKCPIFIAPAMDLDMYAHPSNQKNIATLKSYGNKILPVGEGQLASGLEGKGRMLEPGEIIENIITFFNPKLSLKGRRVLITAGPTHEAIDPVRFIGNYSSGKMGFALAKVAAKLGAEVILISVEKNEKKTKR